MTDSNIQEELRETLLAFVKRASEKGATAAEVEALPAVVNALMKLIGI